MTEEIIRVRKRTDGVKYIIIPKNSKIDEGYVVVSDDIALLEKVKSMKEK